MEKTIGLKRMIQESRREFNELLNSMSSNNLELEFKEEEFFDDFKKFEEYSKEGVYCFSEFIQDLKNSTNLDVTITK